MKENERLNLDKVTLSQQLNEMTIEKWKFKKMFADNALAKRKKDDRAKKK